MSGSSAMAAEEQTHHAHTCARVQSNDRLPPDSRPTIRCLSKVVSDLKVGSFLSKQLHCLILKARRKGGEKASSSEAHSSAMWECSENVADLLPAHCSVEGCPSILVLLVHTSTILNEKGQHLQVAIGSSNVHLLVMTELGHSLYLCVYVCMCAHTACTLHHSRQWHCTCP